MKITLQNYTIKTKIKLISFMAIAIISLILIAMVLFSQYLQSNVYKLEKQVIYIEKISNELKNESFELKDSHEHEHLQEAVKSYTLEMENFLNLQDRIKTNKNIQKNLEYLIIMVSIVLILYIILTLLLHKTIIESLNELKNGMKKFFQYLSKDVKSIDDITVPYNDEIGEIIEFINDNLHEVHYLIESERKFQHELELSIEEKTHEVIKKSQYLEQYIKMINEVESVIQFDLFGNITHTNENFCKLSKYSEDEIIGNPIVTFLNSNDNDIEFFKEITNVIKEGTIYKGINSDIAKDGTIYTTQTVVLPLKLEDNTIEHFFCIRTDISQILELTNEIIETQKDVIATMGEIGESRCKETGLHVKRVAEYSRLLAEKYNLSKIECEMIYNASPMHDIGKVGIPDDILKKPGKLTVEEFEIMKTHTQLGYDMLKNSNRDILSAAATIAYQHHEKYDGTGYPNGKKGDEIHIFGRITAIADIFDALGSDRCYKKAWPLEKINELLLREKGKHFDPILIDLFMENQEEFLAIRDKYSDDICMINED